MAMKYLKSLLPERNLNDGRDDQFPRNLLLLSCLLVGLAGILGLAIDLYLYLGSCS